MAANRMLGTDAAGLLADLAIPSGGPAWLPASLGMAGQGLVVPDTPVRRWRSGGRYQAQGAAPRWNRSSPFVTRRYPVGGGGDANQHHRRDFG